MIPGVPIGSPDRVADWLRVAAAVLAGIGVVVVAVAVVNHEAPKLTATTLVASVEDETGSGALAPGTCDRQGAKTWSCSIMDRSGSGGATYGVTVTSDRCWRARLTKNYGEPGMPEKASGCIH
jgi:hypothetical protein